MKDFFECLAKFLINNAELKKVVDGRIYPYILPQQPTLPSIVYTPISTIYGNSLGKQTGFVRQIVQFSVHNTTFGKTRKVGRVLRAVLEDFHGQLYDYNIQATHTLTDITSTGDTMTNYKVEEYSNILEFEFNYMEQA